MFSKQLLFLILGTILRIPFSTLPTPMHALFLLDTFFVIVGFCILEIRSPLDRWQTLISLSRRKMK